MENLLPLLTTADDLTGLDLLLVGTMLFYFLGPIIGIVTWFAFMFACANISRTRQATEQTNKQLTDILQTLKTREKPTQNSTLDDSRYQPK